MARILVAEDDDMLRGLVVRALNEDGHEVIAAEDGATAFHTLTQTDGVELLLTDVKMPVMDGIELALSCGHEFPDLPIMLMTGYADQRERAHELDALVHEVINKPFSVAQIQGAVREALIPRR